MFDPEKAKNDRQISLTGGFKGRRGPLYTPKRSLFSWKIPVMVITIGILIYITPSLFKAMAH